MSDEEKKAIEYFKEKIKNKLPLYEETYIDGKPYRRNILQLETNFTEEQANKTEILLNLIEKQQKEIERMNEILIWKQNHEKQLRQELEDLKDIQQQICNEELFSKEYVDKNYIKKSDLKGFVNAELKLIEKCRKDTGFLTNQQYDAMEAVYKAIKNIFLEE